MRWAELGHSVPFAWAWDILSRDQRFGLAWDHDLGDAVLVTREISWNEDRRSRGVEFGEIRLARLLRPLCVQATLASRPSDAEYRSVAVASVLVRYRLIPRS